MLYSTDEYITDPVLAAVGQLQFEVVQYRMKVGVGGGVGDFSPVASLLPCLLLDMQAGVEVFVKDRYWGNGPWPSPLP